MQPRITVETTFRIEYAMPRISLFVFAILALVAVSGNGRTQTEVADEPAKVEPIMASDSHDRFMSALVSSGLRFDDESSAIEVGLSTCDALRRDVSPAEVAELLTGALRITTAEAQLLILTSVDELCPEYLAGSHR